MTAEDRFDSLILWWASALGRDPRQVKRQIRRESNFNPYAKSSSGALGLAQFEKPTWTDWAAPGENPCDADAAIHRSCQFMRHLEQHLGALDQALAAYNAGPGRVQAALQGAGGAAGPWLARLPIETQDYVAFCLDYLGEQLTVRVDAAAQG